MATIRNRKTSPLQGVEIVSQFPGGLDVSSVLNFQSKREVVDISENPRLITNPENKNEKWWVDISSLFEESEGDLRDIKPEFADYPLTITRRTAGLVLVFR